MHFEIGRIMQMDVRDSSKFELEMHVPPWDRDFEPLNRRVIAAVFTRAFLAIEARILQTLCRAGTEGRGREGRRGATDASRGE